MGSFAIGMAGSKWLAFLKVVMDRLALCVYGIWRAFGGGLEV